MWASALFAEKIFFILQDGIKALADRLILSLCGVRAIIEVTADRRRVTGDRCSLCFVLRASCTDKLHEMDEMDQMD